jgi:hypothetical protein
MKQIILIAIVVGVVPTAILMPLLWLHSATFLDETWFMVMAVIAYGYFIFKMEQAK